MSAKLPSEIKWATRQRLQFIETMSYYTGHISRSTLAQAFGISDPAATKDLKLYNELATGNLTYDPASFGFIPNDQFQEIFADLTPETVLSMIANNLTVYGNPANNPQVYNIAVEKLPLPTRLPDKKTLAQVVRAIKSGNQLSIEYHSLSSRDSSENRIIEPHALINNGLRWHIRAYSHETYDFRDFVLSRITQASLLKATAESSPDYDDDWTEKVTVKLKPHPKLNEKNKLSLQYDYNINNESIELEVRRSLVGYLLQRMSVDTTKDASLNPNAYQLVLENREEIEAFAGWAFL